MISHFSKKMLVLATVSLLASCGSSDSGSSDDTSDAALTNAGAVVGAVFSSSGEASISTPVAAFSKKFIQSIIHSAHADTADDETCQHLDGPSNVDVDGQGESGTYGAVGNTITLDADTDFCADSAGGDVTGDGTDGEGLFASFVVSEAIVTCDDDSTATMSGEGVFRDDEALDQHPEIYGHFTITVGSESGEADCSIILDGDSNITSATCTNAAGDAVTMDSGVVCNIDAE